LEFEQEPARGLEGKFKDGELVLCKLDVTKGFHPANKAAGARLAGGRGGEKVEERQEDVLRLLVGGRGEKPGRGDTQG